MRPALGIEADQTRNQRLAPLRGGYYTMTEENWPLIGPMRTPGAFIAGALSGFGSMAACATGRLRAAWLNGSPLPDCARALSSERCTDAALMAAMAEGGKGGL